MKINTKECPNFVVNTHIDFFLILPEVLRNSCLSDAKVEIFGLNFPWGKDVDGNVDLPQLEAFSPVTVESVSDIPSKLWLYQ